MRPSAPTALASCGFDHGAAACGSRLWLHIELRQRRFERCPQITEFTEFPLDIGEMRHDHRSHVIAWRLTARRDLQNSVDVVELQTEELGLLYELQILDRSGSIFSIPIPTSRRRCQESDTLVIISLI